VIPVSSKAALVPIWLNIDLDADELRNKAKTAND
jgi:hypothetical protein